MTWGKKCSLDLSETVEHIWFVTAAKQVMVKLTRVGERDMDENMDGWLGVGWWTLEGGTKLKGSQNERLIASGKKSAEQIETSLLLIANLPPAFSN